MAAGHPTAHIQLPAVGCWPTLDVGMDLLLASPVKLPAQVSQPGHLGAGRTMAMLGHPRAPDMALAAGSGFQGDLWRPGH